jgi:hypothetical protein
VRAHSAGREPQHVKLTPPGHDKLKFSILAAAALTTCSSARRRGS